MEGERVRGYERVTRWEFCFEKAEPKTRQNGLTEAYRQKLHFCLSACPSFCPARGHSGEKKWGTITEGRRLNGIKANFQSEKCRDTHLTHTLADAAKHAERGKDSRNKITGGSEWFLLLDAWGVSVWRGVNSGEVPRIKQCAVSTLPVIVSMSCACTAEMDYDGL